MAEITLAGGSVVRYEVVPFTLGFDVMDKMPELRYPDEPTITLKTKVGTETVPAPKDSPEWREYDEKRREIDAMRAAFSQYLPWQEGVLEWKLPGSDKWESEPPDDYQVPRLVAELGGFAPHLDNRRIAYIRYVVCRDMRDVLALNTVLLSGAPLTEQEVSSAVDGFPGAPPRQENAARARKRRSV